MNNDLIPIKIDFAEIRGNKLNESWLLMFGSWIQTILGEMFGGGSLPVTVKGTPQEVESFANTLGREKRYLEAYRKYGLDNAKTYVSKAQLDSATKSFQQTTGIKWPFKE
jgi:hypothetical protein